MIKIVVADKLDTETIVDMKMRWGVVDLADRPGDLLRELADADALVVRSRTKVTKEILDAGKRLKAVARAGVGLDNIDTAECARRNVLVINTPGAATVSVAELAIGLMLSVLRKIPKADAGMKAKKWEKKDLTGSELFGKTVGIVGFGKIGKAVAERILPFGVTVLAMDPHPKPSPAYSFVSLEELLRQSDIVTLHTALTEETRGMLSRERIALMKPGAVLVNTARGALVDEDALYDSLKGGKLAGAGIDVYSEEPYSSKLCELGNVVLTPHLGGDTAEGQARVGKELIERLTEILG